ncbi:MAG: imidazole glycerol phosphate synthase, glutamine amidotransferase subunit [Bdellovibrionales bacterium RIFOXYD1_FULL_53_11]|nr:MAG: imidazole glycerol phosphate synthase, glutamine amidotransferase subunit [Bdellovibrionales bacterium RIFOXYD1_FULL_53_11]
MKRVVVVDYGMGNLFSVCRALEATGASVLLTSNPDEIQNAERLVLPGVGAFAEGMAEIGRRGLADPILAFAKTGRPLLGICLGMQLMFESGEEFGTHEGLGLLPGSVVMLPTSNPTFGSFKIPHIGWNKLAMTGQCKSWNNTILKNTAPDSFVYFVHSYECKPVIEQHCIARTEYCGCTIAAVVRKDNISGCQFHPEKSGKTGLGILTDF